MVAAENSRSADYNFANIFMWDRTFKQQLARIDNRYVVMPMYSDEPFFVYPVGSGDVKPAIEQLNSYAKEHGFPFTIRGLMTEHIADLEARFPGCFDFHEDRAYFDYIYPAQKLATLSGKKLHGKRNHINRFLDENEWSYQPLTSQLAPECMDMLADWSLSSDDQEQAGLKDEHMAIERAFGNYDYLGLEGGVLRVDGRIAAFTVGERITEDTFNIHFEKAYASIQGAYPMINREFVRQILQRHPDIAYINREDDMGRENLRQAKLSYHPEFLVEKHTAVWKA